MILAQEFVTEKSIEITAIPKLLEKLDLKGHIVTIDAMGTHTHIAQLIVDKEADYMPALKGNQGNSHKEVMNHFEIALRHFDLKKAKGWTISQDHEKAHGRKTTRTVLATKNLSALDPEIRKRWPELKSLIVVENDTKIVTTGKERKKNVVII
jgi:predicted transposase YbfD/YdcC